MDNTQALIPWVLSGLVSIIGVLSGVIVYQNKQIVKIQNDYIANLKGINDKMTDPLASISQTMSLMNDKLRIGRK